ncbi:hypothetical protein BJ944DRAFT_254612 [Cunninghamella echinulata]|nr:hypothetical protein BJ944DRAFT_254612 [Cunninghamella echinulata]
MGFLLFGLLTWIALTNCQPSEGYINDHITMIVVPAGLGVLGGILFVIFWNIGIYLVGAIGGLGLGLFILCWKQDLVITSIIARPCFLVGMSIVVGAITFFVETYVILFSTSFIGAFIFIIGVDVLARTGYVAGIRSILDRNPLHVVFYSLSRNVYILLAFTIVLFLIAFGWQFLYNRGRQYFGMVYTTEKIKSMAEPSPPIAEEKKEDKPASPPPQQKEEATTAEPSEAAKPKDNPT